ncbi:unnamed protein product [Paramecium primaurelia]|uniref:Transmembrane protein n=1 Tax=Paramecium primaurelia TaxID=5886 RepID=A0A8S1LQ41_PARPR|nr:unnamed protein product [Paramecium primaurelia]
MFTKVKNYFKSLRMSNQIILINFCIITFTVLIILVTYQVQSAIFFTFIEKSSQTLSQKQEKQLVQLISKTVYIAQKFSNDFFQYVNQSRNRYRVIQIQFQECLDQEQINIQTVVYNSDIICQGFEKVKSNDQGQFLMIFYVYSVHLHNYCSQYFGSFPASIKFKNYSLYTRPWYINHMTQSQIYPNSSYFYSPILLSARDNLPFSALRYSLRGNDQMFGIALQLLPRPDNNTFKYLTCTLKCTIETFHQLTELVRITNTSYTGFNETDWQTIQQNSMINQNRDLKFYLMNKIYKISVFVYTYFILKGKFNYDSVLHQIIFKCFKNIQWEISDEIQLLIDNLELELIQQIQIQIGCCAFLLLVTANLIKCISAPLLQLILVINQHVMKISNNLNSEIFKIAFKTKTQINQDLFSSLVYKFMALKDLQTKRSQRKSNLCNKWNQSNIIQNFKKQILAKSRNYYNYYLKNEWKIHNLSFFYFNNNNLINNNKLIRNQMQQK